MSSSQRLTLITMATILSLGQSSADADVYNWQTRELIPGTAGIVPGPGVDFSADDFPPRPDLRYADFSGGLDLTRSDFEIADLSYALFEGANLTDASLDHTILTGADFNDAIIPGASFRRSGKNLTFEQLASTASYQEKDLRGIEINIDMRNWDLSGQDLRDADFFGARLGGADLTGAIVNGTQFPWRAGHDQDFIDAFFTKDQLYSTASYQAKDLRRIAIVNSDLSGWDFSGQDLRCTEFAGSNLQNADLSDTDLRNTGFRDLATANSVGLERAIFNENAIYNEWTAFPPSFDPVAAGLTFQSSLGDFDLNGVLDARDIDMLMEMFDWEDRERSWREISQCSATLSNNQFYLLDGKNGSEGDHRFWSRISKTPTSATRISTVNSIRPIWCKFSKPANMKTTCQTIQDGPMAIGMPIENSHRAI